MKWALFNLFMMIFWLGLGVGLFFFPEVFGDEKEGNSSRYMFGTGAMMLALWNLVRFWSIYSAHSAAQRRAELDEYRPRRSNSSDPDKPVVLPEFDFDHSDSDEREDPPA